MDEVLRSALKPVLRDLRGPEIVPAGITDEDDWMDDVHSCPAMLWSADGSGSGVHVARSDLPAERVAAIADQVQEWAIEELATSGKSTSWPECPQHPNSHPLQAVVRSRKAWWVCPRDGAPVVRVGTLSG